MCMHSCGRMGLVETMAIGGFIAGFHVGGGFLVACATAAGAVFVAVATPPAALMLGEWRRRRKRRLDFPRARTRRLHAGPE